MKFKLLLPLVVSLSFSVSNYAIQQLIVTLPDQGTLEKRIDEAGVPYWVHKTSFIKQLAGQRKTPEAVVEVLEFSLAEYKQNLSGAYNPAWPDIAYQFAESHKSLILEAALKDSPQALEHLKTQGLYTPIQ